MAAETATYEAVTLLLLIGAFALYLLYLVFKGLHERHQLWKYISEDENLADPIKLLYCYKAREVENSESGGENQ
ncbi:hypothetical protein KY092_08095 [Natronomonas gomsonensis]|uniref:hypothetical protein n=1 Tax=Natronomonas gomsonensis TaxID=1046043 RepID=UPI0020CA36FB|nr:hypothetical protein [Natronomonas gomsonensis]MCY4730518.1 hypothetical protein [Natronomonas gomsonensis]